MLIPAFKNAALGTDPAILNDIHLDHINVAIQKRTIKAQEKELLEFLNKGICLKLEGTPEQIILTFKEQLSKQELPHGFLLNDLSSLVHLFQKLSQVSSFKVFFSAVETNMCQRFHTDINYLRLLCTYYGPATLWLPNEIVDTRAHYDGKDNDQIVKDPTLIQQANTGDILLLKGVLYPNTNAIFHRSPSIQESREKRLLLRIDMN